MGLGRPFLYALGERDVGVSVLEVIVERLDAERFPLAVSFFSKNKPSWTEISRKSLGDVFHHHVVMAIADEKHGVGEKHLIEEATGPSFCEVRTTEIGISQDDFVRALRAGSMEIHKPFKVIPQWEGRGYVGGSCDAEISGGRCEVLVKICGDKSNRNFMGEHL